MDNRPMLSTPSPALAPLRISLWCRVVDNWGDVGVCWRLARQLLQAGHHPTLWIDEPALAQRFAAAQADGMDRVWRHWGPDGVADEVLRWQAQPGLRPQLLMEAFGGGVPEAVVAALNTPSDRPLWVNLEHLSAEPYVERSHGLFSPQQWGPAQGWGPWFFYPGFTPHTGGLIREPQALQAMHEAAQGGWLWAQPWAQGLDARAPALNMALMAYPQAPLEGLLQGWMEASTPTALTLRLWCTPGPWMDRLQAWLARHPQATGRIEGVALPWLGQGDFDRLLSCMDLNAVRGEDSWVRALWAGRPFLWQVYPQSDGAHWAKLEAFARRWFPPEEARAGHWSHGARALWRWWNGLPGEASPTASLIDALAPWRDHAQTWRDQAAAAPDLCSRLLEFVASHRGPG